MLQGSAASGLHAPHSANLCQAWTVLSLLGFSLYLPHATLTTFVPGRGMMRAVSRYASFFPDPGVDLLARPLYLMLANIMRLPLAATAVYRGCAQQS